MKNIKHLLVIIPLFIFVSCGSIKLHTVDKSLSFNKNTTFAIKSKFDKTYTERELRFILSQKGFNIVSPETAIKAAKCKGDLNKITNYNPETIKEIYSVKDFNSIYIIDVQYICDDVFYDSYKKFYADILNADNNERVMYATFLGDKTINRLLNQFLERILEKTR